MKAKSSLILEQLPEGGCLIVDEGGQQSHALDADAAAIWACVERSVTATDAIAAETGLDADTVTAALARFVEAGLVEVASDRSRRELLSRAAAVAGAAAGLALIQSIGTPPPAAAQSPTDEVDN
ncbi:MAG TPA: twin-arginine translocation signal domain-containing protein [Thermoanaerobaculia bacterium]|nr:twin-arginine translocation signal domain-containing protein [Thermoanaerobaculia bacterium]